MKITKAKMTQILLDLIYLEEGLYHDGAVDHETLKQIRQLIDNLRFWIQFIK